MILPPLVFPGLWTEVLATRSVLNVIANQAIFNLVKLDDCVRRYDIQHIDSQLNDTQYNYTQHNDT